MQAHPYQETIDSVDQIAKRCAPATCCVSGEYPTGLAGRRCVLSHSMFLRSTIHLGLVGEMHMHNGKKYPPHYRMKRESNERMPGQSGFLSPRDLFLAEMLEVAASGSGQIRRQLWVVAGRRESLEPTTTRRVCAACDRTRFPPGLVRMASRRFSLGLSREDGHAGWSRLGRRSVAGAGSRAS